MAKNVEFFVSFVCWFVCLSITPVNVRVCSHDFAMKALEYRNDFDETGYLPYLCTWCGCGLSANLGCRSEMCCTRLAENTGCKKSPSEHHRTTLSDCILAIKAHIDSTIGKKLVKQQYLLHVSPSLHVLIQHYL